VPLALKNKNTDDIDTKHKPIQEAKLSLR